MSTPIPPTIPSDDKFTIDLTRIQRIEGTLESTIITDNKFIWTGGSLSNLNDPVLSQDASTLAYALANAGGGIPAGPLNSVQYNNTGTFDGSSDLLFNDATNTLTAKLLSNGTGIFGEGTIDGLTNPVNPSEAATKSYVDNFFLVSINNDATPGPTVYTAAQMVNGIIERDLTGTPGTSVDITADAVDIIAEAGGEIGGTFSFAIKNITDTSSGNFYDSVIQLNKNTSMGTGVTMGFNTQNIYPGYQYSAILKITSPTTVKIINIYNGRIVADDNWNYRIYKKVANANVIQLTDYNLEFVNTGASPGSFNASGESFGDASDLERIKVLNFIPTTKPSTFEITPSVGNTRFGFGGTIWFWHEGGFDFYLTNPATSTDNITLVWSINSGTADPNSDYVIPPGFTGWFMYYQNWPWNLVGVPNITAFTLGIFPTV